jgi:hypothetical protein
MKNFETFSFIIIASGKFLHVNYLANILKCSPLFSTLFLYLHRTVVNIFSASFNIKSLCVLPLHCICVFRAVLTVDSECASRTFHQLVFLMGARCVLCKVGTKTLWWQ